MCESDETTTTTTTTAEDVSTTSDIPAPQQKKEIVREADSLIVIVNGKEKKMCKHCSKMLDHSEFKVKKNGKPNLNCKNCVTKAAKSYKRKGSESKKGKLVCECGSSYYEYAKERHLATAFHHMKMYRIEKARLKQND